MDQNKIFLRHKPDICAILMRCIGSCCIVTKDQDRSPMSFGHVHGRLADFYFDDIVFPSLEVPNVSMDKN